MTISKVSIQKYVIPLLFIVFTIMSVIYQKYGVYRGAIYDQSSYVAKSKFIIKLLPREIRPAYKSTDLKMSSQIISNLAFQGFLYPAYLAFVQVLTQSTDIETMRLSQIFLNLISLFLMIRILNLITSSENTKLIATLLLVAYFPFVYMSSQLLSENLVIPVLLMIIYLTIRLYKHRYNIYKMSFLLVAIAILINILFFTRPAYFYFSIAYISLIFIIILLSKCNIKKKIILLAVVVGAYMTPYTIWIITLNTYIHSDKIIYSITGDRKINSSLNESYSVENDGFPKTQIYMKPRAYVPRIDFKKSIAEYPLESVLLRFEKLYRLWASPSTIYTNPLTGNHDFTEKLHLLLVLLAFLGLFALRDKIVLAILGLPIFYTTAVYTLYFSEEHRFIYPIMPLIIIFAVLAIDYIRNKYSTIANKHDTLFIAGILFFGILIFNFPYTSEFLSWYRPWMYYGSVFLGLFLVLFSLYKFLYMTNPTLIKNKLFMISVLIIVSTVTIHFLKYNTWYIWSQPLNKTGNIISKTFTINPNDTENVKHVYLQIDLTNYIGNENQIEIIANGKVLNDAIKFGILEKVANYIQYPIKEAPLSVINDKPIGAKRRQDWQGFKKWAVFPVDINIIKDNKLTITIRVKQAHNNILINGSYLSQSDRYCGPRLTIQDLIPKAYINQFKGRFSLWKYQTDGEIRLYDCQKLADSTQSSGKNFNIRLQIITYDYKEIVY